MVERDGILSSFHSAVEVMNCILAIQAATRDDQEHNLRIGIRAESKFAHTKQDSNDILKPELFLPSSPNLSTSRSFRQSELELSIVRSPLPA